MPPGRTVCCWQYVAVGGKEGALTAAPLQHQQQHQEAPLVQHGAGLFLQLPAATRHHHQTAQQGRRIGGVCSSEHDTQWRRQQGHDQSPTAESVDRRAHLNASPYSVSAYARAPFSSRGSGMLKMTSACTAADGSEAAQAAVAAAAERDAVQLIHSQLNDIWMMCCVTAWQAFGGRTPQSCGPYLRVSGPWLQTAAWGALDGGQPQSLPHDHVPSLSAPASGGCASSGVEQQNSLARRRIKLVGPRQ